MSNKLSPIEQPYPSEVAGILAAYPQQDGYILSLFRTFANSLRFLKKGVPNLLDKESPLPLRIREIVILRTTANKNCEYEWGVHVSIFARAAKLTPHQVAATASKVVDPENWSPVEVRLINAVDELCTSGVISEDALAGFESDWTKEQQLEVLALVGTHHTISFVANTARLQNEQFGASFPA